jgi:hypothetical protein
VTRDPRLRVTIDLGGVLLILLVAAFGLVAATVIYGLWTKSLEPSTVLTVVGTMFSGVLAGAIAASRGKGHTDDKGGRPELPVDGGDS